MINKKTVILGLTGVCFLFFACNRTSNLQAPNIILILADDLGVPQVGCYSTHYYQTPHIDNLAQEGMKFTSAYAAAAICSPTRASIVTGKYPARLHITDFIAGNNRDTYPLTQPNWQKFLPTDELTIGEVLKENGYNTAWIGKWHLSKTKTPPLSRENNPDKQGFDEYFITYKPSNNLPLRNWQLPELDAHNVDTITSRSIDFIERNAGNPFFLVISHNTIHDPLMERAASIERFKANPKTEQEENNPVIATMIERLDRSVGRVIEVVERSRIEDNTIVIFYSDNGARDAHAKQTPLRKGKGWLYEGGIRVPLVVKWKGKIAPNSVNEEMVSSIDLFPTILDLTSSSHESESTIDGVSIYPLLMGNGSFTRQTLFWNYPHYHRGSGMRPACAVRSGDFKLIEWYEAKLLGEKDIYELYNLVDDPGEQHNLAVIMPEKVRELKQLLHNWKIGVNAQEPIVNPNFSNARQ
ncbi:MAG: sulfatase [Bacteroidota bacterium]